MLLVGDELYQAPAFRVDAVDTDRRGDVFRGALMFALLRGDPPDTMLRFANAAAAVELHAGRRDCWRADSRGNPAVAHPLANCQLPATDSTAACSSGSIRAYAHNPVAHRPLVVAASSTIVFGQANAPAGAPAPPLPAEFGTQTGQRIRVTRVAGGPGPSVEHCLRGREDDPRHRAAGTRARDPRWRAAAGAGLGGTLARRSRRSEPIPMRCTSSPSIRSSRRTGSSTSRTRSPSDRRNTIAISRGRFDGTTLRDVKEIFVADAWETSGNTAGRVFFGPGGMLFMTVGDRDRLCCTGTEDNSLRMKAQALDNHVGKTLRLRDDGIGAAGQSVRRPRRRQAGDLHLRPSQRLRADGASTRPARSGRRKSGRLAATR